MAKRKGSTTSWTSFAAAAEACTRRISSDGRTFDSIDEGMAYAQELGFPDEILARGERAAEGLPNELVYTGFSLRVLPAQKLAQTRPGARGALLFYSCVPPAVFRAWLREVPVQVLADPSLPSYDPGATALATRRVLDFLSSH